MTAEEAVTGANGHAPRKRAPPIKKPTRPDFTARDAKVQKLKEKVQEYEIEAKKKGSEIESLVHEAKANNKLEGLKRSLANTVHTRTQVEKLQANAEKRLSEFKNPKNSNKRLDKGIGLNLSAEDIMQRMEQLKEKVVLEQDPEERERIISRIQALNSSWMELSGTHDQPSDSNTSSGKDITAALQEDLSKYALQLKEMHALEEEQREAVDDMREKMNASQPVIDRLRQEREVCLTVVHSLRDKIKDINDEYAALFDKYKEDMKEWNAQMDVIMAERRAEREAEQKAREAERLQREIETKGPPFSTELLRCDQLEKWCKQYAKEGPKVEKPPVVTAPEMDGMVALQKDNGTEDVFSTSRSKNKKRSKSSSSRKSNGQECAAKVHLDIETLGLLNKLKLPIPGTTNDIPGLVEKLAAKRAEYEDKQKRVLAGEKIPVEEEENSGDNQSQEKETSDSSSGVAVNMRCDEAFGQVILEIAVN